MDIGERIELEEPERRALRTGEATVPQQWPLGYLLTLEELMRERILDKQSLLDEFRVNKEMAARSETVFRLRTDLTALHTAHQQLFEYALAHHFNIDEPPTC